MKTFAEEKMIPVNALTAWMALKSMDQWLPQLKSITRLEWDDDVFFHEGRQYRVHTPEGVVMKSMIVKADEKNFIIQIHAHFFLLKSRLTCKVIPISGNTCKIVRIQNYPGITGSIFSALFHRRERNETAEYVNVWSEYALRSMTPPL